jgi:hypothetical protein
MAITRRAFTQPPTQTTSTSGDSVLQTEAAVGTISATVTQRPIISNIPQSSTSVLSLLGDQGINIQNSTLNSGTTISLGKGKSGLHVDTTGIVPVIDMADGIFSIGKEKTTDGKSAMSVDTEIFCTGGMTCTSDERLKDDITLLNNVLEKINKLKGVTYTWKDGHGCKEIGVIAQDIKAQFPELVRINKDNFFSVDYSKLTAVLIEGIKEMTREIDMLKNTLKEIGEKKPRQLKVKEAKEVKEVKEVKEAIPTIAKKPRQRKVKEAKTQKDQ